MAMIKIDLAGNKNTVSCRICKDVMPFAQTNEFVPFNKFVNNKQQIQAFAEGHYDIHVTAKQKKYANT